MEAQVDDPHRFCQECYYSYRPALHRVLKDELTTAIWCSDNGNEGIRFLVDYYRPWSPRRYREEVPSLRELCWRRAMMIPVSPAGPRGQFPSLLYLAKLKLWEHLRKNSSPVSDYGVSTLPIPPLVQQDLIKFIADEEISIEKHVSIKLRTVFVELFLRQIQ